MISITRNSIWLDNASRHANGRHVAHMVFEVSSAGVATWSEPLQPETEGIAGYSWLGPIEEFVKQFTMVRTSGS